MFEVQPAFDLVATETHGGDWTQDGSLAMKGWEILLLRHTWTLPLVRLCREVPVEILTPLWCAITSIVPASLGMQEPEGRQKTGWKRSHQPEASSVAVFHWVSGYLNWRAPSEGSCKLLLPYFLALCERKLKQLLKQHCHSLSPHPKKRKQMLVRASTRGRFSAAQVRVAPECFPMKGFLFEASDPIQVSSSDGKE